MEKEMETLTRFIDTVVQFAVAYGFQILGALVFLLIGLKIAGWAGSKVATMAERKDLDVTLGKFIGNVVKLVVVVFVVIITLGNFGITIAPLIALAGASAFGATLAIQGPLSNYGAGLAIILARPFVVGNTITVRGTSGVVSEVKLAATVLVGEDGERITVPNKQIVGEVLTNSHGHRVVQSKLCIAAGADADRAIEVLRQALSNLPEMGDGPAPQVGIHDFTYGGIVIGLRFWVPSQSYFQIRYAVNQKALAALAAASIPLMPAAPAAIATASLSADDEDEEG